MGKILLIGLGRLTGAILRYGVGGFFQMLSKSVNFPFGTPAINVIGSFLIGVFSQLADSRKIISPETRNFLFVGLLGAFTTFSTFSSETINLINAGKTCSR